MRAIVAVLLFSSVAWAEVPDAALRAVGERRVTVETVRGAVDGRVVGFDAQAITLALPDGRIVAVARGDALGLRLPADTARVAIREPSPPERERHVGVELMLTPGVAVDVEYGLFYAFGGFSPVFPLASSGVVGGFAVGAGVSPRLSQHWRFDLFALVAPLFMQDCTLAPGTPGGGGGCGLAPFLAVGVGAGVHYTSSSGWTVGLKVPLLGAAVTSARDVGEATGFFYLSSLVSLPIFTFGYRF